MLDKGNGFSFFNINYANQKDAQEKKTTEKRKGRTVFERLFTLNEKCCMRKLMAMMQIESPNKTILHIKTEWRRERVIFGFCGICLPLRLSCQLSRYFIFIFFLFAAKVSFYGSGTQNDDLISECYLRHSAKKWQNCHWPSTKMGDFIDCDKALSSIFQICRSILTTHLPFKQGIRMRFCRQIKTTSFSIVCRLNIYYKAIWG